ncbi:urease accessory protein UreF, partial [Myxococcota bacterium]|nr:urease accessory protein UreF [Myxococcota bacterium]
RDRATLVEWLEGLLAFGSAHCDAGVAACAHRAVCDEDAAAISAVADFGAAIFGAPELARESFQQGNAFWKTIATSWPHPRLAGISQALPAGRIAYPVAVGAAAAVHELPLDATCLAYLHAFVANGVSSAIRLGMLGQTDGQHVLRACEGAVVAAAERAGSAELESLGSASLALDLFALTHETQTTRLFRS